MPRYQNRPDVRKAVADRANNCCEYCRCTATVSLSAFEVEHINPIKLGGLNTLDNFAWSCRFCNAAKNAATTAPDPQSEELVLLFPSREQSWRDHFAWDNDGGLTIAGLSATGRATVSCLQLNRAEFVNLRRLLKADGKHPPLDTPPDEVIP
ncbi:MAG: HNH endonuclease [Armatimonadetes bacterium]|nr:HNH endonuclease [Armatimonadota bacterium]